MPASVSVQGENLAKTELTFKSLDWLVHWTFKCETPIMFYFNLCFERTEKVATSEMFERETRRERVLEAINLQKETQLRMKNKGGFLNILAGKKQLKMRCLNMASQHS